MRLAILVAYLILAVAANRAAAGCNGLLLGTTDYNGSGNSIDRAWSVLVDSSGNVVVAGDEAGIVGGANWRVRRYDPTLTSLLSSTDYDGPGNSSDIPSSVVLDGSGNLLVAGFETGSTGGRNWRIRRYDPTLTALLSTTDYSSPGNNSDYAYSMAVEGNGDVVVAGLEVGATGGNNWRLRRYDSTLMTLLSSTDYNGPGNGSDGAYGVAIDGSGNVLVAGGETGTIGGNNWRVRRYDATLMSLLSSTDYNGPVNSSDTASCVVIDGSGNVVVAGDETGSAGANNWRVRKYNPTLTALLSSTDFNGPGNSVDNPFSMAVDGNGNVIVGGEETDPSGLNWRLRQYDSTLSTLISSTNYDGPANGSDIAYGLAIDGSRNIVVAGYESGTAGSFNWRIRKYSATVDTRTVTLMLAGNPVSVGQLFQVYLTITNTGCSPIIDARPELSSLPGSGTTVLLTGPTPTATAYLGAGEPFTFTWTFSATAAGFVNFSGTVMGWDPSTSATVMVASTGTVLIQTPAGLTGAIAVSPATVYPGDAITLTVTASKTGEAGVTGLKGATAAVVAGVGASRALGPTPAGPFTLTSSGASQTFTWIYTAGLTPGTLTLSVSALGADANSGAKLSTGMLTSGVVTILSPYEPCPSSILAPDPFEVFDSAANGYDEGNGIAVDPSGSVFVAAREDRDYAGQQGDGAVIGYPPGGGALFSYHPFASAGSVEDYATAVALAPGGLVYFAGVQGAAAYIGADTTAGANLWAFAVPGPAGSASDARGVAADAAGNFIVTGRQFVAGQNDNMWLAKYSSAGTLLWSVNDNSPANSAEAGYAVAIDPSGSIYVAGYELRNDLGQGRNIAVWKYSPGGALIWKQTDNSPANGTDEGRGVAVDAAGNVYACGFETRTDLGQAENGWVRKYDPNGTTIWTNTFNAPYAPAGGPDDRANAIALAPNGDVYVTGREERSGQNGNIVVRRYDSNGLLLEVQTRNGPANGDEQGNGVAVGPNGIVYVVATEDWNLGQATNFTVRRWSHPGCLTASLALSRTVGSVGQWITAVLTVTNTGSSSITTLVPTLAFPPGIFTVVGGPTPASVASLGVGVGASFTWTLSVSGGGAADLTGTGTGTESATGKTVSASASAAFIAQTGALLTGRLTAPGAVCVGQVFAVTATVSNTGQATATGVGVPDPLFTEGPGSVVQLSAPTGLTTLAGGGSVTLTWTYSAAGLGSVRFSGTATGIDGNTGFTISSGAFSSTVLMVGAPALLEAQGAGPLLAPVNSTFNVTLTVTNTGAGSALTVVPTIAVSPSGAPVVLVGPVPSGSVSIASGASQTFTWTCSASGWGAATFTMSVTGSDACGNLAASATVFTLLGMPAALAASGLTAAPDPICTGGLVTITLAVTNTGQVPANVLTPGLLTSGGGATAVLVAAPGALTGLVGGAAAHLSWTYSTAGSGPLFFSATVTAVDARSGASLTTGNAVSNTLTVTPAAVLVAASSSPVSAIVGEGITVTLTVTNTGGQDAVNVSASPYGNSAGLVRVSGPAPSSPVTIPAGGSQTFSWTYSVSGAGPISLTLTATGQTCSGSSIVQASAPISLTGLRPAALVASNLTVTPATAQFGATYTASFVLSNTGDASAVVSAYSLPVLAPGSTGGVGSPSTQIPATAFTLTGGGSVLVSWTYTASAPCGVFSVRASATGTEYGTSRPLFTAMLTSNTAAITGTPTGLTLTSAVPEANVQSLVKLTAHVSDSCGLSVASATVFFAMVDGGGSLSTMSGFTDGAGNISVSLTLGPDPETDHVQASIPGAGLAAIVAVKAVNPLLLQTPGAALDKNAVNLGRGEVVLARIYPLTDEPILIRIFTASGRLVRTLKQLTPLGRGQLIATWDGKTEDEFLVARGVYLVTVDGGGLKRTVLKVVVK